MAVTIEQVSGWKSRKGKQELLKALEGKRLTARQAVLAKCYECTCGYADGTEDCGIPSCPLHQYMPFRVGGVVKVRKKVIKKNEETS